MRRSMRMLYFHQHFATPEGTGGTRSYEMARALAQRNHDVTMICGRSERTRLQLPWIEHDKWYRGVIDGIDVIALPLDYSNHDGIARRFSIFVWYALRSVIIALRFKSDVVFATSTPLTAALPGIAARLLGRTKRFVFEVRDLWPELPRALGMKNPFLLGGMSILEWSAYWSADAGIGLSPGIVRGIRDRRPSGLPIAMIPNGCDLDLFTPTLRRPLSFPGVEKGDFTAGFLGAHGIANGLHAVLDVAEELMRLGRRDIKLLLVGDGACKNRLVERAGRDRLSNCIFHDPIRKVELAQVTASLDCGLMVLENVPAFYFGTSPNKFFDYLSAGIPVVCNYPGWLAGLITQHGCGIAIPPATPQAFAAALIHLADNPGLRVQMGKNARALAESTFGRDQQADVWCQFVTEPNSKDLAPCVI